MPRAPKACAFPQCEERVTGRSYCPTHQAIVGRDRGRRRGTTAQRGYGAAHQRERARWAPLIARGLVDCWRCGKRIVPDPTQHGDGWDVGHDDHDRSITRGPEHARQCNRSTAGQHTPGRKDTR